MYGLGLAKGLLVTAKNLVLPSRMMTVPGRNVDTICLTCDPCLLTSRKTRVRSVIHRLLSTDCDTPCAARTLIPDRRPAPSIVDPVFLFSLDYSHI